MNKRTYTIAISFLLAFAMLLSACESNKPETLEDLMKADSEVLGDVQKEAEKSSVKLTVQGNEIIYEYDLSNNKDIKEDMIENEEYVKMYNTALDAGAGIFEDTVKQTEERSGIEGLSMVVKYTYKGKEIASRTYTASSSGNASASEDAASEEAPAEDGEAEG